MRKSIVAAAIIAASASAAGCHSQGRENPGPTVSRTWQVGNFHQIEVAGPYDVEVRTGSAAGVAATGGEKILGQALVEVKGDTLTIGPKERHGMFHFGWSNRGHAKFVVTVPELTRADLAGSGNVVIDKVAGTAFEGGLAGSGDLSVGSLKVQSAKFSIAGSGNVKAGGGTATTVHYDIAGSGDIDAAGLQAQDVKVGIMGSGNVKAQAKGSAAIDIMGSGDATVTGGAKCQVSKMGSGEAHCS
ncbi:MAG: head GIN domain-containing protein [Sphingomicrobium sp.]